MLGYTTCEDEETISDIEHYTELTKHNGRGRTMSRNNTRIAAGAMDPDKAARVQAELTRLQGLFAGADENRRDFIKREIEKLAWLNISIMDLQTEIDERGPVLDYQNGKGQSGKQANPACRLLIEYQKLANTTFRALLPVLPDKQTGQDKFAAFRHEFDLELDTDNV